MSLAVQRPVGWAPTESPPRPSSFESLGDGDAQTMYQSSMVIRGAQPILVDTGPATAADLWLETVFGLVDPQDVRWVFVSHNDSDHNGNVLNPLAACPQATLITTSPAVARMTSSFDLPYRRMEWLNFGDTLDAGDRTIEIIDPPVYDSPVTQGLFDRETGAMWAVERSPRWCPATNRRRSPRIFRRRNGRVSSRPRHRRQSMARGCAAGMVRRSPAGSDEP